MVSAGTAWAAGSLEPAARIINAGSGWDSESWIIDSHSDRAKVSAKYCRDEVANGQNDWIQVKMWRHAGIFPPENQGTKQINCYAQNTWVAATWTTNYNNRNPNMEGPETFHFQLVNYSGGTGGGNVMDFRYKVEWDCSNQAGHVNC